MRSSAVQAARVAGRRVAVRPVAATATSTAYTTDVSKRAVPIVMEEGEVRFIHTHSSTGPKPPGQQPQRKMPARTRLTLSASWECTAAQMPLNTYGNKASAITPEQVAKVREATKDMKGFYQMDALLKEHPLEK